MTHIARETAFDRERTRLMENEILLKQANGFTSLQTIPLHCVSSNYKMFLRKFGYSRRSSRIINPFRLGFSNPYVNTHFNFPYEAIFITEAQKYLNSRMSKYYPDWQSRWYEQHGHNNLDIWLDTQRPNLIDVNIRELSRFIEIVRLKKRFDHFGEVCSLEWTVRIIDNCGLYDKYMASGKRDKSCYTERVVKADYNVFSCYDSQCCKPKFFEGKFYSDFDYSSALPFEESFESYMQFLIDNDDELPQNFYKKKEVS